MGFLDREVERLTGRRVASPVVDTVWLARRLLEGRQKRVGLASLAYFFGTATRPCHRALAGLGGDGGDPARADRARPGAREPRPWHSSSISPRRAPPARGQALARRGRAAASRRLPLPRPKRAGALRRSRPRPARAPAVVLPHRAPAARGRGGSRGARTGRVAGPRLGARGGARGASAPARAAPAGERAQRTSRPLRLPSPTRRRLVRHRRTRAVRPAQEPAARPGRGPRTRRLGR